MLRWMSGYTVQDRIKNKIISEKNGVALIVEKVDVPYLS